MNFPMSHSQFRPTHTDDWYGSDRWWSFNCGIYRWCHNKNAGRSVPVV